MVALDLLCMSDLFGIDEELGGSPSMECSAVKMAMSELNSFIYRCDARR